LRARVILGGGYTIEHRNQYKRETQIVPMGNREITIEHLTPILTPKEQAQRKREVEAMLYGVFRKYTVTGA